MPLYHIDTDMGVDDGLALVAADRFLTSVSAISTVFGNVPVETATRNAQVFRELLHRSDEWPIVTGASWATDGFHCDARHVHGTDGLGGAVARLDPALLRRASDLASPLLLDADPPANRPVTLIGLGPATNIPNLVSWYEKSAVKRIIMMSGAFFDTGNVTEFAEFNAYCDPFALQATLELGIPVTIVPLDVCRKVQLSRETMHDFRRTEGSALGDLIATSHMHYMDMYREQEGINGCFPHDAITVLVTLGAGHFCSVRGRVSVDCTDSLRGRTTIKLDESSHVEVVMGGRLKWAREKLSNLLHSRRATSHVTAPRRVASVAGE